MFPRPKHAKYVYKLCLIGIVTVSKFCRHLMDRLCNSDNRTIQVYGEASLH